MKSISIIGVKCLLILFCFSLIHLKGSNLLFDHSLDAGIGSNGLRLKVILISITLTTYFTSINGLYGRS